MRFFRPIIIEPPRFSWLISLLLLLVWTAVAVAPASAARQDRLKGAKDCSQRLYKSKKRIRYRDQWMRCVQGYESYYRKYPKGRQADEALYATAKLYKGLYGYSRLSSDLNEAINRFRQVVKRFPKSRFADDAQ